MKHLILLLLIPLLLAAGCVSADPEEPDGAGLTLLAPSDPFPIFSGQAAFAEIIQEDSPLPPLNYSMGYGVIAPGNATPPHRLLGSSELVYVIEGTARIQCDNETITAGEGEFALLPEGALQSIAAAGDAELRYLSVIQPPFTEEIEISGDDLAAVPVAADGRPIVVRGPSEGIEWDYGTGTLIYTLVNPVLMPEQDIPIDYSAAFAEILPGGHVVRNRLIGLTEVLYVIDGEIVIASPRGGTLRVPAGSAGVVPADMVKDYRNPGQENAKILSFVDPAWRVERAEIPG
ncbi:MAG: cupin domain-containing protein [Methanomicrobiaceae archaeon]|uniref:Cupin type-2 domain-containing protein n=1 Tax=hydrocarbon metagenome TaxID=938273 RepID=A0A0W8FIV1_9ZZZZ|nr:cupin domain-containing protein [Methanomicrobiaceae archaeon]MDD5420192.1 cupin domain-containing protein [Methanomicrobiaceae archaeon]